VTGLQPPAVPVFRADTQGPQMAAMMNALVRDPLAFLMGPPTFRARRAGALNLTEGRHHQIPFDAIDEDTYSGWTSPVTSTSTTLNGGTIVGATSVTLTSATGFAIGDVVRIDTAANTEYRTISNVAGSVITVPALNLAHSTAVAAVEVTSDPSVYVAQATGWYDVDARTSLSGTGAANLALAAAIAVNGASHTGVGLAWEGMVHGVPTGTTTQFKANPFSGEVYLNVGDRIQLDLWFSTESAIVAVDITAGWQCALDLVHSGV
jgi:hypothetical protein